MFLISLGIVFTISEINKNQRVELALQNHIDKLKIHYNLQIRHIVHFSDEASKNILSDPYVLTQLENASKSTNPEELAQIRNELYIHLKSRFDDWKTDGVSQIHFLFPNNVSFLRMHKPELYGDNLSDLRKDISYANKTKKYHFDLTDGKSEAAFRNIFPIFSKNGKYLGAIDISIPVSFLQKEFFNLSKIHTHFLLNKTLIQNQLFSTPQEEIYTSAEDENHIILLTENHTKEKCIINRKQILLPKYDDIQKRLQEKKPFAIVSDEEFDNKTRAISFYPLFIPNFAIETCRYKEI